MGGEPAAPMFFSLPLSPPAPPTPWLLLRFRAVPFCRSAPPPPPPSLAFASSPGCGVPWLVFKYVPFLRCFASLLSEEPAEPLADPQPLCEICEIWEGPDAPAAASFGQLVIRPLCC